jgi:hypothetical protein
VYRPAPEETEPRIAQSTPRPVAAATGPGPMPSAPAQPGQASETPRTQEGPGQRSRRRRRRRGRRGGMPATALMGTGPQTSGERDAPGTDSQTASVDSNPTPPPAPEGQGPDTGQ